MTLSTAPIFVIGNPRSGTTVLRLMLTCHPRIVIPPEGGFLIDLYDSFRGFAGETSQLEGFARAVVSTPKMEEWNLTETALLDYLWKVKPTEYAELSEAVYHCYARQHTSGDYRWGDKNNYYLNHIRTIAQLYPEAQFLHIVRDGRDVACSYRDMAMIIGRYAPKMPKSVVSAAQQWKSNLMRIRRSFSQIGWWRAHELRYENLVREPEETLRTVCNFLGEDYSEQMLNFHERNLAQQLEPVAFNAWKQRTREKLTTSRVERWRTEMFTEDVVVFEASARRMLQRYSYRLVMADASPPTRALYFFAEVATFGLAVLLHARRFMRRLAGYR